MSKMESFGGAAFPVVVAHANGSTEFHYGMTLRDWFAGQALAGLLAQRTDEDTVAQFARSAFAAADAMLKAREKR